MPIHGISDCRCSKSSEEIRAANIVCNVIVRLDVIENPSLLHFFDALTCRDGRKSVLDDVLRDFRKSIRLLKEPETYMHNLLFLENLDQASLCEVAAGDCLLERRK